MIKFIFQNWLRRKERFLLSLVGVLIISAGLTYLLGLSNQSKGTVLETLQDNWVATYDIVVRPEGSRSITENKNLLEPNYMSGLSGGITLNQYETIKQIDGVDVAAPIAMLGFSNFNVSYEDVELPEPGIYKRTFTTSINNGLETNVISRSYYFTYPDSVWNVYDRSADYGTGRFVTDFTPDSYMLLAAIDPEQENKLIGLENALLTEGDSRYFTEFDKISVEEGILGGPTYYSIPILVNAKNYIDGETTISYEKVAIDLDRNHSEEIMEDIRAKGGYDYLQTIETTPIEQRTWTIDEMYQDFISIVTGVQLHQEKTMALPTSGANDISILYKPTPVEYTEVSSPFPERWPYTYQIAPIINTDKAISVYQGLESYRPALKNGESFIEIPRLKPKFIGFYDPSKLDLSLDPTTELPMETYRPASAEFVMDADGNPVSPPVEVKPTDDPYSFLTSSPSMLTTIEAAAAILGDAPISTIRIKVNGVTDLTQASQEKLERIANEIEAKTGLITDITLGSSPQLALAYVPGLNGDDAVGWIQQPWVNIGSAITLFNEANLGFIALMVSIVAVAITYIWSVSIVNVLARRKEFGVLLAIGWRPAQLNRMLLLEGIIFGLFATAISWLILSLISILTVEEVPFFRFILTGSFAMLVYVIGSFLPMQITKNIKPYEAMREGEIAVNSKRFLRASSIPTIALNHFLTKWKRSILSVFAIALPSTLLAIFIYITIRMRGVMFTSLLGQYVSFEVSSFHYITIGIALLIALLTTTEINWQNVSERQHEIGVLQALGWKRRSVRKLILLEGIYTGLAAMICVVIFATISVFSLYQQITLIGFSLIIVASLVPLLTGFIGVLIPAERASRLTPMASIRGTTITTYFKYRKLAKSISYAGAALVFAALIALMVQAIDNINKNTNDAEVTYTPTSGETAPPSKSPTTNLSTTDETTAEQIAIDVDETSEEAGPKPDYLRFSQTYFNYEIADNINSVDVDPKPFFMYYAKKVNDNPLQIEVYFEPFMNDIDYYMKPRQHFLLYQDGEILRPSSVEILEVHGISDNHMLMREDGGKIHAIATYEGLDDRFDLSQEYYFLFLNYHQTGKGYAVRFDPE